MHILFLKIFIVIPGAHMFFGYNDESFRYKILKVGDLARFKKLENTVGIENNHIDYIGLIINKGSPCSDGEIIYQVLCEDSIVRSFFDYEASDTISAL